MSHTGAGKTNRKKKIKERKEVKNTMIKKEHGDKMGRKCGKRHKEK